MTEHKIELCTVYGRDTVKGAHTLFAAIQQAQQRGPVGNTAILWIRWFGQEVDFHVDLDNRRVELAEPSLPTQLTWLRHGKHRCLLVDAEPLSPPVFKRLLELSTIPPLIEGANARNIMRVLQKPYMSQAEEGVPPRLELQHETLDELQRRGLGSARASKLDDETNRESTPRRELGSSSTDKPPARNVQAQVAVRAVTEALRTTGNSSTIESFILDARDPASWVPDFFAGIGRQNRLPSSDQLVVALASLIERPRRTPVLDQSNEQLQELRAFRPDQRASAFDEWVGGNMGELKDQLGRQDPDCVRVRELARLVAELAEQFGFPRVWRSSSALERAAPAGRVDSLRALYAEVVQELAIARDALLHLAARND